MLLLPSDIFLAAVIGRLDGLVALKRQLLQVHIGQDRVVL